MRIILSVLLAAFLSLPAAFAQSSTVDTGAVRPIQPSQSPAASSPTTVAATTVEFAARPLALHQIKLPAGTRLDVEAVYTVSSLDMHPGDLLSFRVLVPVKVDDVTVIELGSLVTGRVVESKRARHWGKAGKLIWTMQDVVAVDLTRCRFKRNRLYPADEMALRAQVTELK